MNFSLINTILVLVNVSFGIWLIVNTISYLLKLPKERDIKPLILPIFCTLGYVVLQMFVVVASAIFPVSEASPLDPFWRLIEGGFILSLHLCTQSYRQTRSDCKPICGAKLKGSQDEQFTSDPV